MPTLPPAVAPLMTSDRGPAPDLRPRTALGRVIRRMGRVVVGDLRHRVRTDDRPFLRMQVRKLP